MMTIRLSLSAIALATLVVIGVPAAASAATDATSTRPGGGAAVAEATDGYTPKTPEEPTLAGSSAVGECDRDVPWIQYSVTLTDPDSQVTAPTARLVLSDGAHSTTIALGELVGNELSGRVLWPGASVDAAGNPTGWPGWALVDGAWTQTDGNFAWVRGRISAVLEVNPQIAVALAYPPTSPDCVTGPRPAAAGLAVTGGTLGGVLPAAIAGGVIVLGGTGLLLLRRRRRQG
ncbi:cell wall protein [Microbacterium sp. zg.B96]|uniref:cell wall protein n=2 Tax=unclassified Microbacterium TaxID=2609290 RepID=UPI00214BC4C3|nr:cell wall protein [Microbacterium sp. zg.B96]MCR2785602.1 cell wall protein [Microbacterium sp. zg.B96]